MNLRRNLLIGIGHPLLDISAAVDKEFLSRYDLKENDAIIASEKHENLLTELAKKYNVNYTVGGSIQNSLRIVQWITECPEVTTFFGSVGKDKFSDLLYEQTKLDGVNVKYVYNNEPTGTCLVLITGNNRSLCTNPGSSKCFNLEHLQLPENDLLFRTAEYFYMGGFFLNVSVEVVKEVARLAAEKNRRFLFNVSAPFICHSHKDALLEIFPFIDVLFGNKSEITSLANSFRLKTTDLKEIIIILSKWQKTNTRRRTIVLTQGEDPVLVGNGDDVLYFMVPEIKKENIVDTNGAGDAFVGGFLSQYIRERDNETCVKCGIWAASQIIQLNGCSYKDKSTFQMIDQS